MLFFDLHTHSREDASQTIAIHNVYPENLSGSQELPAPFSCGIHPWFIKPDQLSLRYQQMQVLAHHPQCVAIGEAGLDKVCNTPFELQREVFTKMITLSEACRKPLIIHCVKAYNELIALHKALNPTQPWILHGFRGNPILARQLTEQGFFLSFGSRFNPDTVSSVSADRFFLETDDARFEISTLYQQVATLRNIPLAQLSEEIILRAKALFGSDLFQNLLEK